MFAAFLFSFFFEKGNQMKNNNEDFHTSRQKEDKERRSFETLTVFVRHSELITTLIVTAQQHDSVIKQGN